MKTFRVITRKVSFAAYDVEAESVEQAKNEIAMRGPFNERLHEETVVSVSAVATGEDAVDENR